MNKINLRLHNYFICNDCTKERGRTVIFFNDDDNVCEYCGSKDCDLIYQGLLILTLCQPTKLEGEKL